jgi:hypothetical protein
VSWALRNRAGFVAMHLWAAWPRWVMGRRRQGAPDTPDNVRARWTIGAARRRHHLRGAALCGVIVSHSSI